MSGPDALARTSPAPKLPNGATRLPVQPPREGRAARDVDQPAERVAAEEGALRPAHELDLIDVHQLDARRVRVELGHAVDVGGDARDCSG